VLWLGGLVSGPDRCGGVRLSGGSLKQKGEKGAFIRSGEPRKTREVNSPNWQTLNVCGFFRNLKQKRGKGGGNNIGLRYEGRRKARVQ